MQLFTKKILFVSLGAFFVGFVVAIFSGGTPLEEPIGFFLAFLVMFWIFYIPLIILVFIYRKFFPHSPTPPKQEKIKENQKISQSSKNAPLEKNEKKVEDLFDDI
jgi:hypothetical protein